MPVTLAALRPASPLPGALALAAVPCAVCASRSASLCGARAAEEIGRPAGGRSLRRHEAGTLLLAEGEPATHFFAVTDGTVKLYKLLPDGRRQITGFLFAGALMGLAASGRYSYSAEALTGVSLCRFPRRRLEALLDEFPRLERRLLALAAGELEAAQEQMVLLGRKTAPERIASFLVGLRARECRLGHSGDRLELSMTRTDIADYLGLTSETVSRVLSQFRRDGIIAVESSGTLRLPDIAALDALAQGLG